MQESISLIIPAYNEEKRFVPVVDSYYKYLKSKFSDFEIIVVPNNCSDRTPQLSEALSKKHKEIKSIVIPHKIGKGGAVLAGFREAKNQFVGFVDADESTKPREFHKLISVLDAGADGAIGSRALPESVILTKQPFHRRMLGTAFRGAVNLMFGLDFRDTQCGAKVFKKEAISTIIDSIVSTGFEFDVELLWLAKKQGYKIIETPIVWEDSDETKLGALSPLSMLIGLIKIRLRGAQKRLKKARS